MSSWVAVAWPLSKPGSCDKPAQQPSSNHTKSSKLWHLFALECCLHATGVSEGRDPAAELAQEDPREQEAKHKIEQVGSWWPLWAPDSNKDNQDHLKAQATPDWRNTPWQVPYTHPAV